MEQRFTLNKLGRKVRATLNLRGKEEPPSRTGSASPISKPSSPVPEVHDALPPLSKFKGATLALTAASRFRSAGTSNLTSPEGLLVRAHPFFLGTRKSFREQLALALEPLANVEADQEVALEPWEEKVWEVLVPRGEPTAAPSSSKVLLKQGEAVPWQLRGIILATEENVKNLQVLYQKTLISEDLEETFVSGLAGQEIALDLMQESPFTVRLTAPTSGFYFLSWEKLNELRDLFPEDHKKLVDRARKMLTSVMNSWVQKFYARCFPRLFSYVSQDFMSALVELITVRLVKGGEKICREGEPGNFGFYLHAGRAVAQRAKANIIRLSSDKRSWHSWWGMLEVTGTCVEQTCTVIAEVDCMIWVLQSKHMEALRVSFGKECGLLDKTSARHLQLLSPHMDAMRSIAMFADCGKDFLDMLNSEFSQRICARDEVIVRESELGEEMFVLALGKCKVLRSGNDHPVSRLHPGSVFGGQAVLGISQTRKETVMADTVCDVRALSRKALLRVLEKFPEEEERILAIVEAHSQSRKAASTALEQASAGEGGFSQDFIRMLVDNMFEQPFMVNQAILVQGTPGTHLVVLVHGIVEIEANGMVVATVNAPGIFGERGLLVSGSRSGATVRCTTVAECMMLPVDGPSTPVIRQLYEADMKKMELMLQKKMRSTVQTLSSEGQGLPSQQPTSFLKNCDPSFLTRMAQHLEKQVFLPGQTLLEEGADAGFSLLIQQGNASIEKGGRVVGRIGAGEFIGESVALGFVPSATATVRADERMLTFAINNTAFRELVDEFPEEKQRLLDLVQQRQEAPRRRSSARVFNQVLAVNALTSLRETVKTPDGTDRDSVAESSPRPVKRLPGYRSGLNWVRQRRAALEDAMYVRMERTMRSGRIERCSPSAFEPLLPRLPRLPPSDDVAKTVAWNSRPQALPPSTARSLQKSQRVYGRKVWLETCIPRPTPPEDVQDIDENAENEMEEELEGDRRGLPKLEEDADEEGMLSRDSLRSVDLLLPVQLPSPRSLAERSNSVPSSPSQSLQLARGDTEDSSKTLSQQLSKWFGGSNPSEKENPIEALSRFLQQEEVLEEHERQERRREALEKSLEAWKMVTFGAGEALEDLVPFAEDVPVTDLDFEDETEGEGFLWQPVDEEVAQRVNNMITTVLESLR